MISPEYFKNRFMDTFGPVAYILEHCGIYFCLFVSKAYNRLDSNDNKANGNQQNDWCFTRVW